MGERRARNAASSARQPSHLDASSSTGHTAASADGLGPYQLAQAAVYHAEDPSALVTRELVLDALPEGATAGVLAGTGAVEALLGRIRFDASSIVWLQRQPGLKTARPAFFRELRVLRFLGQLDWSTSRDPLEPGGRLLRLRCRRWVLPLIEARIQGLLALHIGAATVARAASEAVGGAPVIGTGPAGWLPPSTACAVTAAARAGGLSGTVHVEAGLRAAVPVWRLRTLSTLIGDEDNVTADLPDESQPERSAAAIAARRGQLAAVRLTRATTAAELQRLRRALDREDLRMVRILLDSDLSLPALAMLGQAGAPIDLVGLRTRRMLLALDPAAVVARSA